MKKPVHSPIGASSMHRWKNCPGSVKLSDGIKKTESVYAEEGTRAHEIAEHYLKNRKWPEGVDPEMLEAVKVYTTEVLNVLAKNNCEIRVEQAFDLSHVHPNLYGTSDCVIYLPDAKKLKVYDYKHGAGISVDVENNEQLMYYAAGALLQTGYVCEKVELIVVQPRANHPQGPIRSWEFDAIDLIDFIADLKEAAQRTEDVDAPLNPGEWCRFCPAAGICPSLQSKAQMVAKDVFTQEIAYDQKKLSATLEWLPVLEDFIKSVREFAYAEATHGRIPPGFKLVEKRAMRKWIDDLQTIKFIEKEFNPNYSRDFYTSPELKSVAQIETIVGKKVFAEKFSTYFRQESSGMTLVPAADKREPAKVLDAKSVFD